MVLIFEAIVLVAGLFFFKNKVKHNVWEAIKTFLIVCLSDYVISQTALLDNFHDDSRLIIFFAAMIVFLGITVYKFKDKRYPSQDEQA
ncbi:hypothetical protein O0555_21605 [Brevibacillus laterosporus]|uniref:hypothetical protein n=1 Tax=Brevibacillus laterosporus TaxID=1465 RepID=UPI0018CF8FE1|nr:hypothetical protein [Brevibacillus laterosporus]MBG9797135.1 hypothetical protein [Brevibacillus laterosporus]MCR8939901.1 hypothetical protein [Brevibacillus laterosporus]MCZ0842541.1 hypothetical protein [Brevibacillus laterosporus]MCZ0847575.1 hypothetical protein [Brevibacillus laterosporus]MED1909563.1 hypothetical protein [Brevibacillus laterosporus]